MNSDANKNNDLEIDALASVVSSFFKTKIGGEEGESLSKLTRLLSQRVATGSSHLLPHEAKEISDGWKSLPAIGNEEENLPLVSTVHGKLYFRRFFEYEKQVAEVLSARLGRVSVKVSKESEAFFKEFLSVLVDEDQALAVGMILQRDLVLLTGGPGTGKTRSIVAMLAAYAYENPENLIALAAPTGKAAFRMRESVLETVKELQLPVPIMEKLIDSAKASTLHRLLGSKISSVDFIRNKQNRLPYDLVIIDEASMVDLPLMAKLCESLKEESKLVLIGDADQLSPVQGGAVFNGLVQSFPSNVFPLKDFPLMKVFSASAKLCTEGDPLAGALVQLSNVHRRNNSSSTAKIGELCDAINQGRSDDVVSIIQSGAECITWINDPNDPQLDSLMRDEFSQISGAPDPAIALSKLDEFRILCANNEGRYGVSNWNHRAEQLLPEADSQITPVVIHVNDYTVDLFNGDDGVVLGSCSYFHSEEGIREIARSRLPQHKVGYATTIHRSQGSEFNKVAVVMPPEDSKLLSRELLYVAVSRAKQKVFIIGSKKSVIAAVERSEKQNSGVSDFINLSYQQS